MVGRYKGSVMGVMWSLFNPLFLLVIYTFVFSVVFKARWGAGPVESKSEFAVLLFVGMIVHSLFAETLSRAPGLILNNVSYVKKSCSRWKFCLLWPSARHFFMPSSACLF